MDVLNAEKRIIVQNNVTNAINVKSGDIWKENAKEKYNVSNVENMVIIDLSVHKRVIMETIIEEEVNKVFVGISRIENVGVEISVNFDI